MFETNHQWLPIMLAIYLPATMFITYGVAVKKGLVADEFPYISVAGNYPPASCVFALFLNFGAVLAGLIMYIRYRQISFQFEEQAVAHRYWHYLNIATFGAGILCVIGMALVASFQYTNEVTVHLIGAAMAFGIGWVYSLLQTVISFRVPYIRATPGNGLIMQITRTCICAANFVLLLLFGVFMLQNGRQQRLVSTVSEWLSMIATVMYLATFYWEFRHFRVRPPKLEHYYVTSVEPEVALHVSSNTLTSYEQSSK